MGNGLLLYGPPGCSKTLMARALATETSMNFLAVQGPELLSKWLGESERALQALFRRARAAAPCIIFFDEIDAIGSRRGGQNDSTTCERVLTQLLVEMDSTVSGGHASSNQAKGFRLANRVIVVAATNRPDLLDEALLRPGRLDKLLYVPPPDLSARQDILTLALQRTPTPRTSLPPSRTSRNLRRGARGRRQWRWCERPRSASLMTS